ncbi:MAG: SAM-dependent chlorinase/fluorinase [Solirubrobacterales bacterium]|nr:SAM-dependent chlorinase/fluorinase [Solirubrobacterales bacterium]
MPLPITFLSDYGVTDDFAGICRAVIARTGPEIVVIDVTHGIARHDVREASAVLCESIPYSPVGVHLAIVDPGVGGHRRALAVRTAGDGHLLVAPDNGLLPPAIDLLGGVAEAVDISTSPFRLERASATFHGRDLFAPVAAHLALGTPLAEVGEPIDPESLERQPVSRPRLEQHRAFAQAERIDNFGNISLDLAPEDLAGHPLAGANRVSVGSRSRRRTAVRTSTFEEVPDGAFLFYEDSSGRMAIAVNRGDASEVLDVRIGDVVELEPSP